MIIKHFILVENLRTLLSNVKCTVPLGQNELVSFVASTPLDLGTKSWWWMKVGFLNGTSTLTLLWAARSLSRWGYIMVALTSADPAFICSTRKHFQKSFSQSCCFFFLKSNWKIVSGNDDKRHISEPALDILSQLQMRFCNAQSVVCQLWNKVYDVFEDCVSSCQS